MNSLETFYPHFTLPTVQSIEKYRYRSWLELFGRALTGGQCSNTVQ